MWDSIKHIISTVAPMLGGLLGGPVSQDVVGLIASALGVENTPVAIEKALKSNPEMLFKLKKLESDERIKLRTLVLKASLITLDEREASLKDTQHARTSHNDHWMPSALTICLALMVSGMFIALFLFEPPKGFEQVLIMISGAVLGAFGTATAFWLGSSKSSADKSKLLKGR